jgi:hypothetical protein
MQIKKPLVMHDLPDAHIFVTPEQAPSIRLDLPKKRNNIKRQNNEARSALTTSYFMPYRIIH